MAQVNTQKTMNGTKLRDKYKENQSCEQLTRLEINEGMNVRGKGMQEGQKGCGNVREGEGMMWGCVSDSRCSHISVMMYISL